MTSEPTFHRCLASLVISEEPDLSPVLEGSRESLSRRRIIARGPETVRRSSMPPVIGAHIGPHKQRASVLGRGR